MNPELINGKVVQFEIIEEKPCKYLLEDGNTLTLRLVLLKVKKLLGKMNPDGTPVYTFNTQVVASVTMPCEMK